MIWNYFRTDDPVTRQDLERVGELIYSEQFLKGLGANAKEMTAPEGFPIIADVVRADELLVPKVLWELPEPLPYQELYGVIEGEAGRLTYETGITDQRREELSAFRRESWGQFSTHLLDLVQLSYRRNRVEHFLRSFGTGKMLDDESFRHAVIDVFQNNIEGYLEYIIDAAYYGGLHSSPILNRLLEAYETGGMPCGWLGPLPEDGGDPLTAIALLHFGRQVEPVT